MRICLVSTYELGHQPLHVASPAAALMGAGHEVVAVDLAVEMWEPDTLDGVDAVAISVPMHTATRLALSAAAEVKRVRDVPVCLYGLYAHVASGSADVDRVITGEYEAGLVSWASTLGVGASLDLSRQRFALPVRSMLPSLDRYAKLIVGCDERTAGYVEASHGCAHRCRHCPVPVVYDGRTRRVDVDVVLEDIAAQVEAGARHITFGDPDFLNRWAHSMKITEAMHERFPDLTFDITTKVSHLLRYESLIPLLASQGCLFVISAFESTNDQVLDYLDKGHTAADAAEVVSLLRANGIEPRPSWLPFTPWTTVDDIIDLFDFVADNDLVSNIDPVQYSIRLLIPPGSLMLAVPEIEPYLGSYDESSLSYAWTAADERTVGLQTSLASMVESMQADGASATEIFCEMRDLALAAAGRPAADRSTVLASERDIPRMSEAWFCCAEPTTQMKELTR